MPAAVIPVDPSPESSVAFLREGYEYVGRRCRRLGSDVFKARIAGRTFHCVLGADAARMFYEPDRFTRHGAIPRSVLVLLQDHGSVATLDAEAHRHRKAMMMALMGPERVAEIARLSAEALVGRFAAPRARAVLHDELEHALCRAAAGWAGVPLDPANEPQMARELGAMVANAGRIGPSNWHARLLRRRTERRLARWIDAIRSGAATPPHETASFVIAWHRDPGGALLPVDVAVVELLNILRPIVAIARFATFAALAMHENPGTRERLAADDDFLEAFVHEVRRHYPFFPVVAGIAREDFGWRDWRFSKGDRFMLDLYGTDHDERLWEEPERFIPERFLGRRIGACELIPQGGGDHHLGHRCAGEWVTIAFMKAVTSCLARDLDYGVPAQDLDVPLDRFPTLPRSGFVVADAKIAAPERPAS